MATIKLQGNASGSGTVTLTAPNTNSARTITLPDQDVDLGSLGGAGSVSAWVNFNGTGTVAIRDDGNVSSITDSGTGDYTTNFSNNLSISNYSLTGFASFPGVNVPYGLMSMPSNFSISTSSVRTFTVNSTAVQGIDSLLACVQVIN